MDSKGEVNQFLSKHSQTMLEKLNRQRLSNQFCDITLLIEGDEFRAHKAVLAACSEYFHELFFERGAASTHEAVVDLSGETTFCYICNTTHFHIILTRHLKKRKNNSAIFWRYYNGHKNEGRISVKL